MARRKMQKRISDAEKVRQFCARRGTWYQTAPLKELMKELKRLHERVWAAS